MKKIISFTNVFTIGLCLLTGSLYAGVAVYLENHYGARINYKISPQDLEGKYIGNNERVKLGDVDFFTELLIRTTGMGSSYVSYYYSLTYFLTDIKNQQARHSNDDAVITIGPSSLYSSTWNLALKWEPKKTIELSEPEEFMAPKKQPSTTEQLPTRPVATPRVEESIETIEKEEELMAEPTAERRLKQIINNNALGSEYARKAKEICDADYTRAKSLGKVNLCSRLKIELLAPKYGINKGEAYQDALKRAKQRGQEIKFVHPDLAPAIEDIKASINRLHNALAGYKTRGEAS